MRAASSGKCLANPSMLKDSVQCFSNVRRCLFFLSRLHLCHIECNTRHHVLEERLLNRRNQSHRNTTVRPKDFFTAILANGQCGPSADSSREVNSRSPGPMEAGGWREKEGLTLITTRHVGFCQGINILNTSKYVRIRAALDVLAQSNPARKNIIHSVLN